MKWTKDSSPDNEDKLIKNITRTWIEKYITLEQDHSNTLYKNG